MRQLPHPGPRPARLFHHGGSPAGGGPVLDFSASINPLGPPAPVLHALRRGLPAVARYPDPDCAALTARLAARHGVDLAQVVAGNGSNELIHALPRAFRLRRAAVAEPTYTEYLRASLLAGAEVDHWLAEGDSFTPEPFDPGGADLVWVCNPNNPTGQLWPRDALVPWIGAFPRTLFAVDEAFLPFLAGEEDHSLIPALARLPNLVVLRSLTKLYALPGLRLGYAVAGPDLAERLRTQLVPWSVNTLAQAAGLAALDDALFLEQTYAWFRAALPCVADRLAGLGRRLEAVPSRAPFLLLRLRGLTAAGLAGTLREHGIVVRDASNFVGLDDRYVRVGLRSAPDNDRLVRTLVRCVAPEGSADKAEDGVPEWPAH
jgi:L-threonine-O-3-phosphate decarboxylase